MNSIKRGDIYWAHMGKSDGHEQRGTRPVLILQNDVGNEHSPTVIVASITDGKKRPMPTHVNITAKETLIKKDSIILLEQIRTIDKLKITDFVTHLPEWVMAEVDNRLKVSLGLVPTDEYRGVKPKRQKATNEARKVLY